MAAAVLAPKFAAGTKRSNHHVAERKKSALMFHQLRELPSVWSYCKTARGCKRKVHQWQRGTLKSLKTQMNGANKTKNTWRSRYERKSHTVRMKQTSTASWALCIRNKQTLPTTRHYTRTWKSVHMWNQGKNCMGRRAFRKSNKSMQPGLKLHGTHYVEVLLLDPWQCTFLLANFPNPHQDACAQLCPIILKIYAQFSKSPSGRVCTVMSHKS